MTAIYLRNPEGGEKVAISEEEAKYDETLGWVRFDPAAPVGDALVDEVRVVAR